MAAVLNLGTSHASETLLNRDDAPTIQTKNPTNWFIKTDWRFNVDIEHSYEGVIKPHSAMVDHIIGVYLFKLRNAPGYEILVNYKFGERAKEDILRQLGMYGCKIKTLDIYQSTDPNNLDKFLDVFRRANLIDAFVVDTLNDWRTREIDEKEAQYYFDRMQMMEKSDGCKSLSPLVSQVLISVVVTDRTWDLDELLEA